MKPGKNPYGTKIATSDYGAYYNPLFQYVESTGEQPNVYEFRGPVKGSSMARLESAGFARIFLCEAESQAQGSLPPSPSSMEACYVLGEVMVHFFKREGLIRRMDFMRGDEGEDDGEEGEEEDDEGDLFRCRVLYAGREALERTLPCLEAAPERMRRGNVHLLCSMDNMLMLQRFDVRLPPGGVDLGLNYGDEARSKFDRVVEFLSKDRSGLVLFSGDPGTGKSTFIKYLTTRTTRKVIYLSSNAADQMSSPDFLTFMMRHRNSVLLLEDAEKALRSREAQDNPAISNILNMTDGILGDCLNIMVVATFNIDRDMIDPALVRKGRLLVEHHFRALPAADADRVLEKIGSDRRAAGPMTLAEIYNPDDNFHEEEERRKVGF